MSRDFWRRKRRDGTLGRVYWTNFGGSRVSTGCTSLGAARVWKAARERERADPRLAAAQKATFGGAVRELYAELRRRDRSAATQKRARQKLGHFVRLWGERMPMINVDALLVSKYIDVRLTEEGIREGSTVQRITIRDELAFLRQLLKLARRHGTYPHAVDDVLPLVFPTGHKPKKNWCRERDFPKLLRQLSTLRAAHLAWIVATGSRLGESYRAHRGDADSTAYRVLIRGSKTEGAWTTIAIPSRMRKWLRFALLRVREDCDRPMFLPWQNMQRDCKAACVRAGIPKVTAHDLRRSFGKWLRLHGFDLETISKLLRHTSPKLAREVYADVEGDELAVVVENAEAIGKRAFTKRTHTHGEGSER